MSEILEFELSKIKLDDYVQIRTLDEQVVDDYVNDFKDEGKRAEYPPVEICFDGEIYRLSDGYHRFEATERLGLAAIRATVKEGDQRFAFTRAVKANIGHGHRLTRADKRRIAERILDDSEYSASSDSQLAEEFGFSQTFFSKVRREKEPTQHNAKSKLRKTKDGRLMDVKNIGKRKIPSDLPDSLEEIGPEDEQEGTSTVSTQEVSENDERSVDIVTDTDPSDEAGQQASPATPQQGTDESGEPENDESEVGDPGDLPDILDSTEGTQGERSFSSDGAIGEDSEDKTAQTEDAEEAMTLKRLLENFDVSPQSVDPATQLNAADVLVNHYYASEQSMEIDELRAENDVLRKQLEEKNQLIQKLLEENDNLKSKLDVANGMLADYEKRYAPQNIFESEEVQVPFQHTDFRSGSQPERL